MRRSRRRTAARWSLAAESLVKRVSKSAMTREMRRKMAMAVMKE